MSDETGKWESSGVICAYDPSTQQPAFYIKHGAPERAVIDAAVAHRKLLRDYEAFHAEGKFPLAGGFDSPPGLAEVMRLRDAVFAAVDELMKARGVS